jgi:hypothetical protein
MTRSTERRSRVGMYVLFGVVAIVTGGSVGVITSGLTYHEDTTTVIVKEPPPTVTVRATRTIRVKSPSPQASSNAATAAAQAALPVMVTDGWTGVRPSVIDFSGDAGNLVTNITWLSWTATAAVGSGRSGIQSCKPDCATGPVTYVPTAVTRGCPDRRGTLAAILTG